MEKNIENKSSGNKGNHGDGLNGLKSTWKQFDNAGSSTLVQLCGSLAGSQYDIVTKEIVALLGPVFACGESELVLGRLQEIESLLAGNQETVETKKSGDDYSENRRVNIYILPYKYFFLRELYFCYFCGL
jgi:hypothetical protein